MVPGAPGLAWQAAADPAGRIAVASDGQGVVLDGPGVEAVGLHRGTVREMAWSPDDSLLALATWDGVVLVLDAATRERLATLPVGGGRVQTVTRSPDGTWLAAGGDGGVVQIWAPR